MSAMAEPKAGPIPVPAGAIAVIFVSLRTAAHGADYGAAADAMLARAAQQPGYLGFDSVRGADGLGITVSYWRTAADAQAWKNDAAHTLIRNRGRADWYEWYALHVAETIRSTVWRRGEAEP
jgi:heme-degrading monooxygenase HmoA